MVLIFENIVNESNKIYNNLYEYICIDNENNRKLKINCKEHGIFYKSFHDHIKRNQGCPNCSKPSRLTNEVFIKRSKEIHYDLYDYSLVNYISSNAKVKIICKNHGIYEQIPKNHLKGTGCPNCCINKKLTKNDFIEKAKNIHGDKYVYDNIIYENIFTKITIICPEHGEFIQTPNDHINGHKCYKCVGLVRTTNDFIEKAIKIHNELYSYENVKYENSHKKVCITCNIHGKFMQTPNHHLRSYGCSKCSIRSFSKICVEWLEYVMKKENIFIQHALNQGEKKVKINGKLIKFDGYCEKTNTVYEYHGSIFHGNPKYYKPEDVSPISKKKYGELYKQTIEREKLIKENGYNLIVIWDNEYKELKNNK
jgi:hypothetical protein